MLQRLLGILLCILGCESTLCSQEPLEAPEAQPQPATIGIHASAKEASEQEFAPVDPDSAEIPKSWFKNVPVKPIELGIQTDDVPAYFRILEHVRNVPPENLVTADRAIRLELIEDYAVRTRERIQNEIEDEAELRRVLARLEVRLKKYREDPFSYELVRDAFNQPQMCQGHVVSFSGHARRPQSFPAGENDYGFDQLYQIWLFDEESNHYPVMVVFSELPENLPVNIPDTQVLDGLSVRGYYFKLWAYEGEEKYHAIPLILAKTVEWNPPKTPTRSFPPWAYAAVILLGVVVIGLIIWSNRSRKPVRAMPAPEENPFR